LQLNALIEQDRPVDGDGEVRLGSSGPGVAKRSPELLMSIMLPKRVPTALRRLEKKWTSKASGNRTLERRSGPEYFGSRTPSSMTLRADAITTSQIG